MPYSEAAPRLAALGLDNDVLWLTLRENLETFGDIAEWARLVTGPVTPEIADADRDFVAKARELLPQEPWGATTWGDWTGALKAATGMFRTEVGKNITARLTPTLEFIPDGIPENAAAIDSLLREAAQRDAEAHAAAASAQYAGDADPYVKPRELDEDDVD